MDFDEYEYLEKTVEGTKDNHFAVVKETLEKGNRTRHHDDDDVADEERYYSKITTKKSRNNDNDDHDHEESLRGKDRERDKDNDKDKDMDRVREKLRDRSPERGKLGDRSMEISRDRIRERGKSSDRSREKSRESDRSRERGKLSDRSREKSRESRDRSRERGKSSDRSREKLRERGESRDMSREKERSSRDRERREREKSRDRERGFERERRSQSRSRHEREHERRSRSRSRLNPEKERDLMMERLQEVEELRVIRRHKDKKETVEPEADPERDQRTVFAYQMPLKATERDVYEFFSKAGKVRDVRLIMDRNSRRSKGVGYIEFYDVMSVPMAIAMSGQPLLGQPVMVKPSEAEKNLVQSNASGGGSVVGPYGATERKLYVGNLHFNMTEIQLKQIFEAFGPVELIQLPLDAETGHCKGFGFVQFAQLEHAKAAQNLNGTLEIAGRTIKVSSVTDHIAVQDSGAKTADFDDDEGGGLALNAQSRALLMQKLDRTGFASSVVGAIGAPVLNGAATSQLTTAMPMSVPTAIPSPILSSQVLSSMPPEPIGNPSECLLLKNMFDPATETDPEFDLDIKDDVYEECSKYGHVKHIHVDKNSAGYVYLRFDNVEGASRAQQAMHRRWFARRLISAIYLQPYEYDAKFKSAA